MASSTVSGQHCCSLLPTEQTQPHFNRFQFFFDSPQILRQAKCDRRYLQRIFREKSHCNVDAFYALECEEAELPKKFRQLYDAILSADGSAIRTYQLIVNSLTFFYSRRTWATSVHKYVIQFLVDSVLANYCNSATSDHNQQQSATTNVAHRSSLFELELVCLLQLFVLRYAADRVNDDTIVQLLTTVREKGGEEHMSDFINGHIINHFGCSLELRLRRIVQRLDHKVKSFRGEPPPFSLSAGAVGRRKLSLNNASESSTTGRSVRCGSSVKRNSSEPVLPSDDAATAAASSDTETEEAQATVAAGIATTAGRRHRRRQQPQRPPRDGRSSSSVGIEEAKDAEEEPQQQEADKQQQTEEGGVDEQTAAEGDDEAKTEQRSPSPPAKRLRSGSSTHTTVDANKGSVGGVASRKRRRHLVIDDDTSAEESTNNGGGRRSNSSSGGGTATAADCRSGGSPSSPASSFFTAAAPNFPITRSATAHALAAAASCSSCITTSTPASRSAAARLRAAGLSSSSTTTRAITTRAATRNAVCKTSAKMTVLSSRTRPSAASLDVRAVSILSAAVRSCRGDGATRRSDGNDDGNVPFFYALL